MTDFRSTKLDNGLEIVGETLPGVQSAAVAVFINHGAANDSAEEAGLAHLAESSIFRGTETRSSRELTEQLDRIGVRYSSSTGLETTLVSALMLGSHLGTTLEILSDILMSADFPPDEVEAVRALQLQEIGQRDDQPAQMVMDLGRQRYFAGHPLGNDVLGTRDSISVPNAARVADSWRSSCQPEAVIVAIAGKFDWGATVTSLEGLTHSWSGSGLPPIRTTPRPTPSFIAIESSGAQENLCFSFPGVACGDPDYYSAALASTVLGAGMNSRLFTEVREKRGLAYSVGARSDSMSSTGIVRVYVGTQPERARESVEVVQSELIRLEQHGVTPEELTLAKTRLKSGVVMGSESTGNRVMSIGRDWFYERRYRPLSEIRVEIESVTPEAIDQYLSRIDLARNLGLVALGPLTPSALGTASQLQGHEVSTR